MLERRLGLAYAGIDAAEVADAEHVSVAKVREARERCGRRPQTGLPLPAPLPHGAGQRDGEDLAGLMRANRGPR